MGRLSAVFLLSLLATPGLAQQTATKKPNELVAGKLLCVTPMPNDLDRWVIEFARHWGKYQVTGNPEGVDLVMKAYAPDRDMELVMRDGVPQPKDEGRRFPIPRRGKESGEPGAVSIAVIDWVTNQPLWQAEILTRKPKKDETDLPVGPETKIFARGMTTDQLAQKIVSTLRQYVAELEKTGKQ